MAKSKPNKVVKQSSAPANSRWWGWKALLHLLALAGLIWLIAWGTARTRLYIEAQASGHEHLVVVLANQPAWMSDFLAEQIKSTVPNAGSSVFDHDLLVTAVAKLQKNPWIKTVHQVRRVYGQQAGDTLLVDCEFRSPAALVHSGESYWLVDNDGNMLPEQFSAEMVKQIVVGRDGLVNIRVIDGVRQPPPHPGDRWLGPDLAAGLDLVKLFYRKAYLEEVQGIDVSNYGGRIRRSDPQLVLETRYGTKIWWGRPVNAKDFFVEISPSKKLATLKAVVQQLGRVDAGKSYLDIRYEDFLVPTTEPAAAGLDGVGN